MRASLLVAAVLGCATPALAQGGPGQSADMAAAAGVSISAQVNAVFDCGPGTPVGILRTSYTDRFLGEEDGAGRIYAGLDNAARVILTQALAQGARAGRAEVVALAYEIDANRSDRPQWRPIGLFLHITDMQVDAYGQASFATRVEFIPDASRIELRTQ